MLTTTENGALDQNRTGDTRIFSPLLYQLSYQGKSVLVYMQEKSVLKAFRTDKAGRLRYLFHGNAGSTLVPLDTWVKAEEKMVTDGSGNTVYLSGFHAFITTEALKDWNKTLRYDKVVVPVKVRETRPKAHSKHKGGVILARWLMVPSGWQNGHLKIKAQSKRIVKVGQAVATDVLGLTPA
jgi:hypothetical protein